MSEPELLLKPALTFEEQIEKMKSRNLVIENEDVALQILQRINYYRFTGYLLPYKLEDDKYVKDTKFEDVYKIYEFDQKLRNLLIRYLESIEVSLRAKISYTLAHRYNSLGYEDIGNFEDRVDKDGNLLHPMLINRLRNEFMRAVNKRQLFATHHYRKYRGKLPIWVAVELMSFGDISTLYSIMKKEDQEQVSQGYFNVKSFYLVSWLRTLRYIRNTCAHYERLYDLTIEQQPQLHKRETTLFSGDKIFSAIYICCRLFDSTLERNYFVSSLETLIAEYTDVIKIDTLGFPEDWYSLLTQIKLRFR